MHSPCICTGLGWDGLNFIAAPVVLWLDLWLKQCWQHTSLTATPEQSLQSVAAFCFFPLFPLHTASRLGVRKKLGGDAAKTADLNCLRGYSIPYDAMLSYRRSRKGGGRGDIHGYSIPSNPYMCWVPAFPEAAKHLPAEVMNKFISLCLCAQLCLTS